MKKKYLSFLVVAFSFIAFHIFPSHAATMEYSVKANIPENQVDKRLSYFDLKMLPGQKQSISITVSNSGAKVLALSIQPNTAMTNENGVIDYSGNSKQKKDNTLKVNFADIVTGDTKVTLQPGETKNAEFTIQMPKEEAAGIILGGFYISQTNVQEDKGSKNSVQIKNRYSYVIGAKLRESMLEPKTDLKLNSVKPGLSNYRTVIKANLQNITPTLVGALSVDAEVFPKGSAKSIHATKKEYMAMAPNSNFDFPISWGNQKFTPGRYVLKMKVKSNQGSWTFTRDFAISDTAERLNDQAVELEETPINWMMIILLGVVSCLLIAVLILVIIVLKRKKKSAA